VGLSRKTLHRHGDNLWLIGGEIISDPSPQKAAIDQVLLAALDDE
jgi:hypothetical protein